MTPIEAAPDGDDTRIDVRFIVSPVAGTFRPAPVGDITTDGEIVVAGGVIGHVDGPGASEAVISFCTGFLVRMLAAPGERVKPGTPLAWLHPVDRPTTRPGSAA